MATNPRSNIAFRMFYWLIFILLIFVNIGGCVNFDKKWRLCVVKTKHNSERIVSLCLTLTESPITCVIDTDRFGCVRRIIEGEVDFTVLEPEELVAIKNYYLYKVLVTNELKLIKNEAERFQIVAIAHKSVQRIWDIKGKRLCHPGFNAVNDWSTVFSTYLESLIIRKECNFNMTLFENRVHALSNFFEMACIAGPWSADAIFDYQLKSKYKNLCAACDNPSSCYNTDKYYGREGALLCLTDNVGDVAWVRLDDARVHFKAEIIDSQDYKFLCPDGTTKPLIFDKPCIWISKPWPTIVATMQSAAKISQMMNSVSNTTFCCKNNVLQLMENYYITLDNVETLEVPSDYLSRFPSFLSAYTQSGCRPPRDVRWCVVSDLESRKCNSLRAASLVYGVEPKISCFQAKDRKSCLKDIQDKLMDIFFMQPEELLEARMKGLKPIVHAMSNAKEEENRIVAIVKVNSAFKSIKDLKGAKASFTGYRSIGWNAFVTLMRNMSEKNWDCSDAQAVAKFFKKSCVLGSSNNKELPANLHSLCTNDMKRANDDLDTFEYLTSGIVDVAFVNLKFIESNTEAGDFYHQKIDHRNINRIPKYRILGQTMADTLQEVPYLLAWTTLGSIVSHENITDLRRQEIYSMLLEMDKLFGKKPLNGQTPAFLMYGPYDGNLSIIFPDGTRHLELHGHQVSRGRNYDEIVEDFIKQEVCTAASIWISHFLGTVFLCMIVVIILS